MISHHSNRKAIYGAVCTAMAAVLVAGCASSGNVAMRQTAPAASAKTDRAVGKAIAAAEKQTAKNPQDAAARAGLATNYLMAGRFESAVTTFEDARYLGDDSARTALGLALAHVGAGDSASAVALLDASRDSIPVTDYGLALALAGETTRGVDVLASAMRGGENTVKLRQNLAYAYALDGRWADARLMAAQDVPANQLDARISEWARQGRPEDFRLRVASMLGAPVRQDQGQPAHLAIARDPAIEAASLPVPVLAEASASPGNDRELPPIESGESFWLAEATRPEPVPAPLAPVAVSQTTQSAPPVPTAAVAAEPASNFNEAFLQPTRQPGLTAQAPAPVAQVAAPAASAEPRPVRKSRKVAAASNIFPGVKGVASGAHLVQLGSFSSRENAERAWSIFVSRNPELATAERTLTEAMVGGRKYWRVSAAGYDRDSARQMCSTVKRRGGGCIAWASGSPLPGAL